MRLSRRLNRRLNHRLRCYLTRRLDGRPFRPPNYLAQACDILDRYIRLQQKSIREDPHLFGPQADRYRHDTVCMEQADREIAAALERVYGPAPPGALPRPSVWAERYQIPPDQMPAFRKWFHQNYSA